MRNGHRNHGGGAKLGEKRELADCTIEDLRGVVRNCPGHNGRGMYKMLLQETNEEVWIEEVESTMVEEEASPLARCPL